MSLFDQPWDVIVIGTGIGGGTAGRALAERGRKVLFIEKGPNGPRAEEQELTDRIGDPVARQIRGYWPVPVQATIDGTTTEIFAPLGAGVGGSSVFYAATLEAPEPHDLDHSDSRPHPTGGWPIGFADLAPQLTRARQYYHVHGTADALGALDAPPEPGPVDHAILARLRENGASPYHAHTALRLLPDCARCLGRKCPRPCKMDGRSAGVEPALATGNAALLPDAEVLKLHTDAISATAVEIRHGGTARRLTAPQIILAAGALSTPRLLMASASEAHPAGPGNHSDTLGRNLMFHLNEMFALWPPGRPPGGASKSVALRDLTHHGGYRMGMVQSLGVDAGYGTILHYLRLRWGNLPGLRLPALAAAKVFGSAKIFVGLLEDLPSRDNRVLPGDRIAFTYAHGDELAPRRRHFRRQIKRLFKGMRPVFLSRKPDLNLGHPCGTARFGSNPATSVTDARGRVHGFTNLSIADASLFPTSMGVNPSLTIAALACHVAEHLE